MKYLIEIHHGIGDIVQITGLIESLFQKDCEAYIALIINKDDYKSLFVKDNRVQVFYRIDMKNMSKAELLCAVIRMRREKFDYFFLSPISNRRDAQLLTLLVNAKHSYGEQTGILAECNKRYTIVKKINQHIVKRNENLLLATGLLTKIEPPHLKGLSLVEERILTDYPESSLQPAIGLCIGTSKPSKNWPLERFVEIAEHYSSKGYYIFFLGGKEELRRYQRISFQANDKWINFMGRLNLIESAALTRRCKIVLGGDTGVMHMAAAGGATTVSLFGCSNPTYHCPYSSKSYYITANLECQYCYGTEKEIHCSDYKCLYLITVEETMHVIQSILDNTADEHYQFLLNQVVWD